MDATRTVPTPKRRMLDAYRGVFGDRPAVAPEFWYYYPAKLLGVDMATFEREVPFHLALKRAFETFGCEGWGAVFPAVPNPSAESRSEERRVGEGVYERRTTTRTAAGELTSAQRFSRDEPSWAIERPVKDPGRDLPAWEAAALGGDPADLDAGPLVAAWNEVGESYLLEAWIGAPFFDFYGAAREGGFEAALYDFADPDLEPVLTALRERYVERLLRTIAVVADRTPIESFCIGCAWSCNSLLGPRLWRRWDKPVIAAAAAEAHRRGRLLHIHFHGRCMETVADFAEIGVDCVCPFERPPGGDVAGRAGLERVAALLAGRTTMNGNVHTVETLIRGGPGDARREVGEILGSFGGTPRVIVGTGDQVGRETPEENIRAMIDETARIGWARPRAQGDP